MTVQHCSFLNLEEQLNAEQTIRETIADALGVDISIVTPDARLVEDLGADSLDVVDLAITCEDKFNVHVEDAEGSQLKTVQDVITLLASKGIR